MPIVNIRPNSSGHSHAHRYSMRSPAGAVRRMTSKRMPVWGMPNSGSDMLRRKPNRISIHQSKRSAITRPASSSSAVPARIARVRVRGVIHRPAR